MQTHVNRVYFVKNFHELDTYSNEYFLEKLASIRPRTSLSNFGGDSTHLFIRFICSFASLVMSRAAGPVVMNAVSERDADGNPVTQQEMFDTKWVALCLVIMLAALAKSAGAF